MAIKIHKSTSNDVYGIREVQRETWLNTYPNVKEGITIKDVESRFKDDSTPEGRRKIEERKKRYKDKNSQVWVAEENERIIGFCEAIKENENNRIQAIYVLPSYQGKGIGRRLIKKAFAWLGKDKDIYVNVARYNQQAIDFYKKNGFEETGRSGVFDSAAKLPSGKSIPEIELVRVLA
jgi:ribosomal protein S18 acetylase RimI-like enzyme